MIRIQSHLDFDLKVPFLTPRGVEPVFFIIPAAKNGQPGKLELENLDAHTIKRLRHHYDRRPKDAKADKPDDPHDEIGLLKIEITGADEDGKKKSSKAA